MPASSGYSLNGVVAPDAYDFAGKVGVLQGIPVKRFVIDTNNQIIFWQLMKATIGNLGDWESSETQMSPGSRVIREEGMVGIRIRAKIPLSQIPASQKQATVTIRAIT